MKILSINKGVQSLNESFDILSIFDLADLIDRLKTGANKETILNILQTQYDEKGVEGLNDLFKSSNLKLTDKGNKEFLIDKIEQPQYPKRDINKMRIEESNKKSTLRNILNSEEAYQILDSSKAGESTWCAGGCAILAFALNKLYNYPIYVIYNHDNDNVDHFIVKTPEGSFIDCDGEQLDILRNFRRKEHYMNPKINLKILPYDEKMNIENIPIDPDASNKLAELIKRKTSISEKTNNISEIVNEEIIKYLNEVRYVRPYTDIENKTPLKDDQTIIVFHGFNKFQDGILMAKYGLSGKENAKRLYSYEYGNNPKGLFVSVVFDVVERSFSHGGVIVEFATKVAKLEAPVWVGGRSYFVQGEYTKSFKSPEEREQQQLANRKKYTHSEYPAISQSDRPELAYSLYEGGERQALFVGDINPNQIRAFWINEKLKNERRTGDHWIRMSRKEFLLKYGKEENKKSDEYYDKTNKIFLPAEDFNINKFKKYLLDHDYDYNDFVEYYIKNWDDYTMKTYFYPKQIEQIKQFFKF